MGSASLIRNDFVPRPSVLGGVTYIDGFFVLVGQFIRGVRAIRERGSGLVAFSNHPSDESRMGGENPSDDLCNLEAA